jgi:penicillin amidase
MLNITDITLPAMLEVPLRRALGAAGALLLALLLAAGALLFWLAGSGRPRRDGVARLHGLSAPADVRFDAWGVPHVRARNARDLAAALGYLHANDRFVQMELGRRLAAGRLAELFGARMVGRDQYSRVLRLYSAAEENLRAAAPETRALLSAYASGVNAWLAERGGDLPPELHALSLAKGLQVEPWKPADSLAVVSLMAFDLNFFQGIQEETRFGWLGALGLARTRDLLGDPSAPVAPEILDLARKARGGGPLAAADPAPAATPGSNAWALGGSRTASGHPLVANDTHLGLGLPDTWYQVLLRSPDYEAAGMTLPGLPVVVIGQNRDLAWALTNSMVDAADLYLEEFDAAHNRVRRGAGWAPVRVEFGTIRVLGGEPVTSRLRSTADRGPLLAPEEDGSLPARSLAWTLYYPGDSLGAMLALGRAHTLAEVAPAIAGFVAPAQNLVVAHRDGGMLETVLGRVPHRREGDGRLPEPAWRLEDHWDGLVPQAANPTVARPPDDLLVSANDDPRPLGYSLPWSAEFDLPYRARRIRQLLLGRQAWTPHQAAALQTDIVSLYALEIVRLMAGSYEGPAARAYAALASWDGSMALRGASALYSLVERELGRDIFGDEAKAAKLPPFNSRERVLRALQGRMSPEWFDDVATPAHETRHDILARALGRAWAIGSARWGPDVKTWRYGDLHRLVLGHPLGRVAYVGRLFNRGFFAVPGSATSIAAWTGSWNEDFQPVTYGPAMRWIADTADPDRSLAGLPGGQSGHFRDHYYDDQLAPFLRGELHSVHWSELAIARAAVSHLHLLP